MRVGIIGVHWGRAHVGTFRRHGCEIAVLVARNLAEAQRVAAEEGVPIGTDDPAALEAVDIVVVASPAPTHRTYVERFAHKPVLCEKPLLAGPPDDSLRELVGRAPLWVNYAFPFLATARRIRELLPEIGSVARADVRVGVSLDAERSPAEWFAEVAIHPLAFLGWLFGPFAIAEHRIEGPALAGVLTNGSQILHARLGPAQHPGITYDLALAGEQGSLRARGGYRPGEGWSFEPLVVGGARRGDSERSQGGTDIWFEANVAAVGVFIDVVRGHISGADATARGLCSGTQALHIEEGIAPLLASA